MAKGVLHVHTYSQTALPWESWEWRTYLHVLNYLIFYSKFKNVFFIGESLFLSSVMWEISLFQLLLLYRSLPIHRDEILLRCSASLAKSSFCTLLWQSGQARGGVERDLWTWQSRLWHTRRTKSYARPPASSPTPSDSPGTQKWDQNKLQLENSAVIQYFL